MSGVVTSGLLEPDVELASLDEAERLVAGFDLTDALEGPDPPSQLERAWALHDVGAMLRREERRADAREDLRLALDAAGRPCGGELSALAALR